MNQLTLLDVHDPRIGSTKTLLCSQNEMKSEVALRDQA